MWFWDHLDGLRNWTQLRLLHKYLLFWLVSVEIYSSYGHSWQASYETSLAYYTYLPPPSLEWLLLSLVSLCTLCSRPVYKTTVPHMVELTYLLVSVVSVTFYRSIHSRQGKNTQEMRVLKPGGCNIWGKGDGNENVYPEECRIIWGVGGQVVGLGYTYSFKDFKQGSWPGYYFKWPLGVDLKLMGENWRLLPGRDVCLLNFVFWLTLPKHLAGVLHIVNRFSLGLADL